MVYFKQNHQLSFAANLGFMGGRVNSVTLAENEASCFINLKGNQAISVSRASFSLTLVYSFK